jgi:hypothetical protein
MTPAVWNTTSDVYAMLVAVTRRLMLRRLRVFALSCCESVTPPNEVRSLSLVVRAVRAVESGVGTREAVQVAARLASDECTRWAGQHPNHQWALAALRLGEHAFEKINGFAQVMTLGWHVVLFLRQATSATEIPFGRAKKSKAFADIAREVFGPLRKQRFLVRWRTETVRLLAGGVHADQAFDRLPILADALEEAGCDNAELLAHCRGPGPHVPGCWALDLVRGCY